MATKERIAAIIQGLRTMGYRWPEGADAAVMALAWEADFADMPDDLLTMCVRAWRAATPDPWWPVTTAIRQHLTRQVEAARGISASPEAAWGEVVLMVARAGSVPPVMGPAADDDSTPWRTLDDVARQTSRDYVRPMPWRLSPDAAQRHALEAGILSAGGWLAVRHREIEQETPMRAAFRESYRQTLARIVGQERAPQLTQAAREIAADRPRIVQDPAGPRLIEGDDPIQRMINAAIKRMDGVMLGDDRASRYVTARDGSSS